LQPQPQQTQPAYQPAAQPPPTYSTAPAHETAATSHPRTAEAAPPKAGNKFFQFISNLFFYLLIIAIIGGSALFAFSNNPRKAYFGYRFYTVKTPSMTPREDGSSPPGGFKAGDTILVRLCDNPSLIEIGDIITYTPGDDPYIYLTHRVVNKLDHINDDQGLFFVTRGDANDSDDSPIEAGSVVGKKVMTLPGTGFFLQFLRENLTLTLIIIVSAIGFIILLRMYFAVPKRKQAS